MIQQIAESLITLPHKIICDDYNIIMIMTASCLAATLDESIFRVFAEDADLGKFGRVVYSLEKDGEGEIKIDPTTGNIRLLHPLDYEENRIKR